MNKEDLIIKWLDNNLTPEELRELEAMEGFESYRKIVDHAPMFDNPEKVDAVKGYNNLQHRLNRKSKVISLKDRIKYISGIAATIAVLICGYLLYQQQSQVNYSADLAEKTSIILPDNSQVALNAQSEITFDKKAWPEKRSLKLDGEAYFKVEKGSAFQVQTKIGWVQVLGTEFNVYNREGLFKASCYEGAVMVGVQGQEIILYPGQEIRFTNGDLTEYMIDSDHPSWIKGRSDFESMPLEYALNEIERQYGVTIDSDKKYLSRLYTGVFPHNDLDQALRSVCQPFGMSYKISENGKNIKIFAID
ncbi:FecR family protein [Robertkochia aurantiaca]|uniref:FecR family protein n=1 Tax=Robertkochia aurantiaca TaxID=2873700 RepID=UPI001CC96B5D|nr:FecR domain-containing protein [Robertkochia sp. 3YJGBD-33]